MPQKPMKFTVAVFAVLLAARAGAEEPRGQHAHRFASDVDAFHAVLAPLWHARAGVERTRHVCAQAHQLEQLATAIRSGNAKPLLGSVANLKTQCQTAPNDIDATFAQVHEAFHHLAEHAQP